MGAVIWQARALYRGTRAEFWEAGERIESESDPHADSPILAGRLVAVAGGFAETVKIALLNLAFAIERGQSVLETIDAKPVRVTIPFRPSAPPCSMTSYALVHHKPFPVRLFNETIHVII